MSQDKHLKEVWYTYLRKLEGANKMSGSIVITKKLALSGTR